MVYVIVRKNPIGVYGELDLINDEVYDTEFDAQVQVDKLQPRYHNKLAIANVV
jgi:hypothetical protein